MGGGTIECLRDVTALRHVGIVVVVHLLDSVATRDRLVSTDDTAPRTSPQLYLSHNPKASNQVFKTRTKPTSIPPHHLLGPTNRIRFPKLHLHALAHLQSPSPFLTSNPPPDPGVPCSRISRRFRKTIQAAATSTIATATIATTIPAIWPGLRTSEIGGREEVLMLPGRRAEEDPMSLDPGEEGWWSGNAVGLGWSILVFSWGGGFGPDFCYVLSGIERPRCGC